MPAVTNQRHLAKIPLKKKSTRSLRVLPIVILETRLSTATTSLMLPDELVLTALDSQYPCRELQIRQLASLLCVEIPPCSFNCMERKLNIIAQLYKSINPCHLWSRSYWQKLHSQKVARNTGDHTRHNKFTRMHHRTALI